MEKKVTYLTIEKDSLGQDEAKIVEFYNRYFPKESNKTIAKNCAAFFIAQRGREFIGICRLLTDFSRYALLLDLIVRKAERNRGVGKTLAKMAVSYCQNKKIQHLILTTDARVDWLTSFYQKLGFKIIDNQALMEFKS